MNENDSFFPPPWNILENEEKTKGWIEFQKCMKADPNYYRYNENGNMKIIQILCDNCQKALTFSKESSNHCLILGNKEFGPVGSCICGNRISPFLDDDKYFCNFECLRKWMDKEEK